MRWCLIEGGLIRVFGCTAIFWERKGVMEMVSSVRLVGTDMLSRWCVKKNTRKKRKQRFFAQTISQFPDG